MLAFFETNISQKHQANMEKQLKTKATLSAAVIKSKERYEAKCMETNQLIQMRQATLPPKEAEKVCECHQNSCHVLTICNILKKKRLSKSWKRRNHWLINQISIT
jgi:hypothetical protein